MGFPASRGLFGPLLPGGGEVRRHQGRVGGDDFAKFFLAALGPEFDAVCRKKNGTVYESVGRGLEVALARLAMERTGNNQVMAARLLGISRNTLRDRLGSAGKTGRSGR